MKSLDLTRTEVCCIYQDVLDGNLGKFPAKMWRGAKSKLYAQYCVQYLIEEVLHWTPCRVKLSLNSQLIKKYKLHSCCSLTYNFKLWEILNDIYPNKYKPWELSSVPSNYWTEEKAIEAVRWLYTEKYKWNRQFVINNCSSNFFIDNHLTVPARTYGVAYLINKAFPEQFELFEISSRRKDCWKDAFQRKRAVECLIKTYNLDTDEEVYKHFNYSFLHRQGLGSLCDRYNSPFDLLSEVFPNKYDYETWLSYRKVV